jgi:hypothetical protein
MCPRGPLKKNLDRASWPGAPRALDSKATEMLDMMRCTLHSSDKTLTGTF